MQPWALLIAASMATYPPFMPDEFDSTKVIGFDQCHRCHAAQVDVLKKHVHYLSDRQFHRSPEANSMAKRLGHRSVKRTAECIRCHYTPQETDGTTKAIAGISCESCHGPAQDWLVGHNDYGGPSASKAEESSEHRIERLHTSISNGMRHPSNLYLLARSCYRCHIVDDEKIVNQGGHSVRSQDFNMVSWSQGAMRHNFYRSGGRINEPSDAYRLRVMHVVGALAELEYSLRAVGKATQRDNFAFDHAKHAHQLRQEVSNLADVTKDERLRQAAQVASAVSLKLGNGKELEIAADQIGQIGWQIGAFEKGESWNGVDALVPGEEQFKGQPIGRYSGDL